MANVKTIAFLALLGIALLTAWRLHTGRYSGTRTKTVWKAALLAVLVGLTTDLNPGLGAAFGASVVIFTLAAVLPKGTVTNTLAPSSSPAAPSAAAKSSPASPGTQALTPGGGTPQFPNPFATPVPAPGASGGGALAA